MQMSELRLQVLLVHRGRAVGLPPERPTTLLARVGLLELNEEIILAIESEGKWTFHDRFAVMDRSPDANLIAPPPLRPLY